MEFLNSLYDYIQLKMYEDVRIKVFKTRTGGNNYTKETIRTVLEVPMETGETGKTMSELILNECKEEQLGDSNVKTRISVTCYSERQCI